MEWLRRARRRVARQWTVHRLLVKCGAGARLAIDSLSIANELVTGHPTAKVAEIAQFAVRDAHVRLTEQPLLTALQATRSAAVLESADRCPRCTPATPLRVLHVGRSGSSAEGLADIFQDVPSLSDYDLMFELVGDFRWMDRPLARPGEEPDCISAQHAPQLWARPTDSPAFVTLHWARTTECEHESTLLALPAQQVRRLMFEFCRAIRPDSTISTPGPAVNTQRSEDNHGGKDHVPCLRLPVWPGREAFLSRRRVHEFPSAAARQELCQFGVHMVPTGREGSATELYEWRLSFSRAEVVAIHQLTATQRAVVKSVKRMKSYMKEGGATPSLKSYYIKTAMLWLAQDRPADSWTGVVDGLATILDWLQQHIAAGSLPCFFWHDIDLLSLVTIEERKDMLKTIAEMKRRTTALLMAWCADEFYEVRLLFEEGSVWRPLPPRRLRLVLTRVLICRAVMDGVTKRTTLPNWQSWAERCVPPLLLASEHQLLQWYYRCRTGAYHQQCYLLQALMVAPEDVFCAVRLTAGDGERYTWDAAPLVATLIDRDMRYLTGDPSAAAAWCHRQLSVPPEERPQAGLTAELDSPRGRAELLLQPELVVRFIKTLPDRKVWLEKSDQETTLVHCKPLPTCHEHRQHLEEMLDYADDLVPHLVKHLPGMDEDSALITIHVWQLRIRHLLTGDRFERQLRAAVRGSVGRWRLRQYVLGTAAENQTQSHQSREQSLEPDHDEEEQRFESYLLKVTELASRQTLELREAQAAHGNDEHGEDESQDHRLWVNVYDSQSLQQTPVGEEPLPSRREQMIPSQGFRHALGLWKIVERHQQEHDELDLEWNEALHENHEQRDRDSQSEPAENQD
ncbi:hypothetical protein FJT64_012786 [Amphibalanus amphitrite]|uniref:Mab-21-like HhH/H2TH-like domain-containing protein n=1 Tax=Amphibalanus amphitrite TaxID=1232801 RepID=A0A6A4UYI4_AMPAM|nr:hypothetical protein FJT64_012786 [Amphibalanus amphitrite]